MFDYKNELTKCFMDMFDKAYEQGEKDAVIHAKWEKTDCFDENGNRLVRCPICGKMESVSSGFCRECGAEMEI